MSLVNGSFEDGDTGWFLNYLASVGSAYGAYEGANSGIMPARVLAPARGSEISQTVSVSVGEKLTGQMMMYDEQNSFQYASFRIYWGASLIFHLGSPDMVEGVWVPFSYVFDEASTKTLLFDVTPGPLVPGHFLFGNQFIFLVDALETETSMIAESLMKWIDAEGFAFGTEGADLFCSHMPDKPDSCTIVYDESSSALSESQALDYDRFGIEIRVRDPDYGTARDSIMTIHRALAAFSGLLAPSTPEVIMVDVLTSPTFMERDDDKRSIWVAHYALVVQSTGDQYRS